MAKHYYRTDEKSDLGRQIKKLLYDCDVANRAADTYCAKAGAKTFYGDETMMAGGVACLGFGDQQPSKKIWRSIGKDGDGLEMFQPNVQRRYDCIVLPRRDFRPSDTATRIYQKRLSRWPEVAKLHTHDDWMRIAALTPTKDAEKDRHRLQEKMQQEIFFRFVEIYYNDQQLHMTNTEPRYRMPYHMRHAIRLEVQRLQLPVVSVQRAFGILRADLTDGREHAIVQPVTPIIFLHCGRYYIGCDYPCQHPDLEVLEADKFLSRRIQFEQLISQKPS